MAQQIVIVQHFDHEGLCQVPNSFPPDKDLCGRNVVLLQSAVPLEMLNVTSDMHTSQTTVCMGAVYVHRATTEIKF